MFEFLYGNVLTSSHVNNITDDTVRCHAIIQVRDQIRVCLVQQSSWNRKLSFTNFGMMSMFGITDTRYHKETTIVEIDEEVILAMQGHKFSSFAIDSSHH